MGSQVRTLPGAPFLKMGNPVKLALRQWTRLERAGEKEPPFLKEEAGVEEPETGTGH